MITRSILLFIEEALRELNQSRCSISILICESKQLSYTEIDPHRPTECSFLLYRPNRAEKKKKTES